MKKLILALSFSLTLLQSCGQNDVSESSLPTGASAIFYAENYLGNNTTPGTGCSTTWVNLATTTESGTVDCALGGGFAGAGVTTSPYRLEFNGTSTSVGTAINAQTSNVTSTTWIAWVNPARLTLQHVLSIDDHAGAFNRALIMQNNNWGAFTGTGAYEAVGADINAWQQIAVVYTPTSITLYKNGTPHSYGSAPTINNTAQNFTIGRSAGGAFDFFQGAIAWVAIYPRALTQEEITRSCNSLVDNFTSVVCH